METSEAQARQFTEEFLVPKIPDLVAVFQYGSSVTGVRNGNSPKPSDIDLLVVTRESREDFDLQMEEQERNIDLLWMTETAAQRPQEKWGNFRVSQYRVLYGPDLLNRM